MRSMCYCSLGAGPRLAGALAVLVLGWPSRASTGSCSSCANAGNNEAGGRYNLRWLLRAIARLKIGPAFCA